ncbi:polysaccharide pyruvyl transferase family protein [Vibrio parahaemolyticus]|uniref:Polysaccharide pyruvyl transferase family protein n=1 Tax=Vibrio parahaemolyticus TaxID=670 RepID=A0AAW8Q4R6_VIBPH|nr:polysaccharide pyruvyl transferase family protein [Vibrio parahaemolyticus]KIT35010.1 hypothetical protein H320_08320 [Vibrio parahaemolyticus 49]EGQ7866054.1 polysaccharide pyruvyl transferase family protein [Vibrio parahaemolyticus]EGQ7886421.1 polysaccharide pyruvyl transferase family protein [Vibrio parahaemolyticus]EGQ8731397.1 hypothetical protein [Vibrio parahaemolyticus]EGQ8887195.1 hypothetical protein [Vibrio parahaemolyticus]
MKKIGILTIHSVYNYGAMLQAYALFKFLSEKNHNVEVIDYRPYSICRNYEFYWKDVLINPKRALSIIKQNLLHGSKFANFKLFLTKDIKTSECRYNNFDDLKNHKYDVLITGSDQIWNPYITGFDESFLLSFDTKSEKMAYSSSFGVSEIPDNWKHKVKNSLSYFSTIGVRENSGKKILDGILPFKDVESVLDPVFLLPKAFWEKEASHVITPQDKFLLVYTLEVNDNIIKYAKDIARDKSLKIVTLHPFKADYDFADICLNTAGPKEFLSLILNATFIVTNSFHGTAFSIIFEKEFSCVLHSKTGTRMLNLFENFSMEEKKLYNDKGKFIAPYYCVDEISKDKICKRIKASQKILDI